MGRLTRLQLIGPFVLFAAIAAAEGLAHALALFPRSELLWYLNLEVFRAFERGHASISGYIDVRFAQFWLVAVPIGGAAILGLCFHQRLLMALSSNLTFVYTCFLAYSSVKLEKSMQVASLLIMPSSAGSDNYLFPVLVMASLLSFAVSHLFYIVKIRQNS